MVSRNVSRAAQAEAVRLVVELGYSPLQAARIAGVKPAALRGWVEKSQKRQADVPADLESLQRETQKLQAQLEASTKARDMLAHECDVLRKSLPARFVELFEEEMRARK